MEMIKEILLKLIERKNLIPSEAELLMREIMSGTVLPVQIGAILSLLRSKGETIEEVTAFAKVMREFSNKINSSHDIILDTCGTGGDAIKTFNVSTTVAFVVAGLDIPVAKHGNRSVTSKSGSADVLEYLGLNLGLGVKDVERILDKCGICFMFAPSFHPAMKYAIAPRRELGIRTVFNILGPLTNPASVKFQVLGVFDSNLTEMMAQVLMNLGTEHALIVHGMEGLDEVSISGKTKITELYKGKMETYFVTPKDFGIKSLKIEEIQKMGDPKENARDLVSILNNKQGPLYDLTLVNAAAALKAAKNIPLLEGLELAKESIESGKAYNKLKSFIKISSNNTSILEKLEEDLWES